MKRKSTICFRRSPAAGLTLVEVVAAVAILGVILVGVVLAKSRHTHQMALAERQQVAVRAADALLAEWWKSVDGVPVGKWGVLEDEPSLVWETRVVANAAIARLGARVIRVEIRAEEETRDGKSDEPLVAVDLVLPNPDRKASEEDGRE
ncbi:MAG: type II secretion system protein [Phycisphaerae bacterium]